MLGPDAITTPAATQDLIRAGQQTAIDRSAMFTMATPSVSSSCGDIRGHQRPYLGNRVLNGLPVEVHGPKVGFNRTLGAIIAICKYANNYFSLEPQHFFS